VVLLSLSGDILYKQWTNRVYSSKDDYRLKSSLTPHSTNEGVEQSKESRHCLDTHLQVCTFLKLSVLLHWIKPWTWVLFWPRKMYGLGKMVKVDFKNCFLLFHMFRSKNQDTILYILRNFTIILQWKASTFVCHTCQHYFSLNIQDY